MIEKKFIYQLIKARFFGIRKELRYLFMLSFTSVFLSQLWLEKVDAFNEFHYNVGIIYIKLCYSYLSAFIFYYLVVYAPKERKRTKAFRFINNKVHRINNLIKGILLVILQESGGKITELEELKYKQINEYCSKIDANKIVYFHNSKIVLHNSFTEFLKYKISLLKIEVQQLMLLNDLLSDEMFLNLNNINDVLSEIFNDYEIFPEKDFTRYSHPLTDLNFERKELYENFDTKYRMKYDFEYHRNEKKRKRTYKAFT